MSSSSLLFFCIQFSLLLLWTGLLYLPSRLLFFLSFSFFFLLANHWTRIRPVTCEVDGHWIDPLPCFLDAIGRWGVRYRLVGTAGNCPVLVNQRSLFSEGASKNFVGFFQNLLPFFSQYFIMTSWSYLSRFSGISSEQNFIWFFFSPLFCFCFFWEIPGYNLYVFFYDGLIFRGITDRIRSWDSSWRYIGFKFNTCIQSDR